MNLTDSEGNKVYLKNGDNIILNGEHILSLRVFIRVYRSYQPYHFVAPNYTIDALEQIVIQWKAEDECL